MSPWETILQHYRFPDRVGNNDFIPEALQIDVINDLAPRMESGHWLDMGTGKTFVSTACALYRRITYGQVGLVLMPPLLVPQWGRWLKLISTVAGNPLTVAEYKGTPAERKLVNLSRDFVLSGIQIFKKEIRVFEEHFQSREFVTIFDEAIFVSNINSDTHQKSFDFTLGRPKMLLTGTPATNPMATYGMMKFTAPGVYRSKKQFENRHVETRDFYDAPTEWKNLDELKENLMVNSRRVLYADMYRGTQTPIYDHQPYDLDPDHYRLYKKLAEEQVLELEDGGKFDATSVNRLRHALGQIIVNYGHFAEKPGQFGAAVEMIQSTLDAMSEKKLLVFVHYRMSVRFLVQHFAKAGARGINSEVSAAKKDLYAQEFQSDPSRQVLFVQYISGGSGLDGLQYVCHTAIALEPCRQPTHFHQAVARLNRKGQKNRVHVIMPVASRTLQVRAFKGLLDNDTLLNQVVRNSVELRREIYGDDQ